MPFGKTLAMQEIDKAQWWKPKNREYPQQPRNRKLRGKARRRERKQNNKIAPAEIEMVSPIELEEGIDD